jgi:hypothetical protein
MPEVDLYKRPPVAKSHREIHLENLLRECLPDIIYVENGTRTSMARRSLIAEIQEILK